MSPGRPARAGRLWAAAVLLAATALTTVAGSAAGEESLSDLEARMGKIQAELDAATARVSELEAKHHELTDRVAAIERRRAELERTSARLQDKAVDRARELYTSGGTSMVEALFAAESFSELTTRAEILSRVSLDDSSGFVRLARTQAELDKLAEELEAEKEALDDTTARMKEESQRLQERFQEAKDDYEALRRKIAAARRAAAAARASQESSSPAPAPAAPAPAEPSPAPRPATYTDPGSDMVCPVAGPHSFTDTWGYPRSGGRTHQGVDIMAAYGTPIVAITAGRITYAGWSSLGGNTIYLTGDDGHGYYYMHNQRNIVTSGRVKVGQQIATVGDTGNATGTPHLHFEYHPGTGSAVNPYPLVKGLC